MSENEKTLVKADKLFDINGYATGIAVGKRFIFSIFAAVAALIIGSLLPLDAFGEKCGLALGWLVAVLVLMLTLPAGSRVPASIICAIGGFYLGLWDMTAIKNALGNSSFYLMFGMTIVALGAELTPMGKRIAYWFLSKFGQKPTSVVYAYGLTTALLSTFIGNIPCIIMMSGIANNILIARGEKPGESKLGRCLMLLVITATMLGGVALITGSPIGNTNAIVMLEAFTSGQFTVTFGNWAFLLFPCFLVTALPMCWIYIKCTGLKNDEDTNSQPKDYYENLQKSMGKVGGSEIRWIVITVVMVICLCAGMDMRAAALLFALISMFPLVGFAAPKTMLTKVPLEFLIPMAMLPLLGTMFGNTGLDTLIAYILTPLVQGLSPLAFSMVCALFCGFVVNFFVNAGSAATAVIMGITAPLCVSLGYNPAVVLLPTMSINSFMFVFSANAQVMLNKQYGWWDDKDTVLPGFLFLILACIVFPVVCCLLGPVFGFSLTF